MILNFKKTALLVGVCSAVSLGYVPQSFAASVDGIQAVQQAKQITGVVNDAYGPVIGANVVEKGTTNGVMTDMDGRFTLTVQPGATLVVSFIGYVTQEVVVGDQTNLVINLKEDTGMLDEVVVVGYGTQKKKLVTGATVQVKGDQLAALNTTSALTAMQSQTPGVSITQTSGQPGEGFKVNIRGLGTVGNYAPLYVIDGVAGGDINSLNPSDIEAIDVLKDAASCAIYGARGANGVILVTTKQGKSGKIQVSYDGYVGWQNAPKLPQLLNAKQYMEVQDMINLNTGGSPIDWQGLLSEDLYNSIMDGSYTGTDWVKLMHNDNAPITNHALNVVGGNEVSKFSLGVSYTNQEGIFGKPVQSQYERTTVRLNSDHVLWKKGDLDVVTLTENLTYNYNTKAGIAIGDQYGNDISNALRQQPITPAYNEDGSLYLYDQMSASGIFQVNPYASNPQALMIYKSGNNISKNHALNMSAALKIQPIKDLVWKSQFNYKMSSSSYRQYTPAFKINDKSADDYQTTDVTTQNASQGWSFSWENTVNYKFSLNQQHNIDVLVGTTLEKWGMGEQMGATNSGGLWSDWDHAWLSNMKSVGTATATGTPWGEGALASFFGRINYDYKETYMLSVILRYDGSSNFARGNRWGTFPSLSAGWVVTNEKFMESTQSWLDFLKIRASWGQNGNCNVDNFQYLSLVSFGKGAGYAFNDRTAPSTGSYVTILSNPDISWETSEQLDLGFDARFFNGRLSMAFDWYKKTTKDWLVNAPILGHYGLSSSYINGGDVENKGIEIALGWNDKVGKDFTYGVNWNIAYNKNEVTRIANTEGIIHGKEKILSEGTAEMFRAQVGYPIGYFWGYKTDGVFQNQAEIDAWTAAGKPTMSTSPVPGDLKFVDMNGDGVLNDDDKTNIGNPHPDVTMGLSFNIGYKGFDLSVAGYGAFGHQIAKSWRKFGDSQYDNYTTDVYNSWHGEGTSNTLPRLVPGNTYNYINISDIYIENADYFKVQNITLGYDFKKLFPRMPLTQARLYVTAQNLFTITGYSGMDPEVGASGDESGYSWGSGVDLGFYPSPRTFMVGVNLKF